MATFLEQLDAEKSKLLEERRRIDATIAGLEKARTLFLNSIPLSAYGDPQGSPIERQSRSQPQVQRASPIRDAVLKALQGNPEGLNYADAAREASKILGRTVNAKTVSSFLSVQARDGAASRRADGRYRLSGETGETGERGLDASNVTSEREGAAMQPTVPDLLESSDGE